MNEIEQFTQSRLFVELPHDFDWQGEPPKPVSCGLGDTVAFVSQPVAKAIDTVLGTNIQNCGGCQQRQETLNKMFPKKEFQ